MTAIKFKKKTILAIVTGWYYIKKTLRYTMVVTKKKKNMFV